MKRSSALYMLAAGLLLVLVPSCRKKGELLSVGKQINWSQKSSKKRLLVFACNGGGGHAAAAQALREYFKDDYEIETVNILTEVLHPIDIAVPLTANQYNGEDLYNLMLRTNSHWLANNMIALGKKVIKMSGSQIQPILEDFLKCNQPDAIVSVIPAFNGHILAVAEKLDIPFAVLALDRDEASIGYSNGIWKPTYKKFIFSIPFDDESLRTTLIKNTGIAPHQIRAAGIPMRVSFLEKKNKMQLRQEFQVPEGKPVVMVLMGSVGSGATLRYARALAKVTCPIHIFLCLGRNEQLRQLIEKTVKFPPHISVSIIGFTDRIADYMTVSNMLITKTGSLSLFEALTIQVPLFLDTTRRILAWDHMNVDFVKEYNFGDSITLTRKITKIVDAYFKDPSQEQQIRANIAQYKLPDVRKNVAILLKDLLAMQDNDLEQGK